MAVRGKKLRGNGMWEASRMMLPEHRTAIRTHRAQLNERTKPELDEQRLEELALALREAFESGEATCVTTFGALGDETSVGTVERIDPIGRYVKLRGAEETVWIPFADIVHVARAGRSRGG